MLALRLSWLLVLGLYREDYLNVCPFDYTIFVVSRKVNRFNHTRWVAFVTSTDRPKSVHNRCVIEVFVCVFVVVTFLDFSIGVGSFVIGLSKISFFCPWYRPWPSPNYDRIPQSICDGYCMWVGIAYSSGHLVPSIFEICSRSYCWEQFSRTCLVFYQLETSWISLGTFSSMLLLCVYTRTHSANICWINVANFPLVKACTH